MKTFQLFGKKTTGQREKPDQRARYRVPARYYGYLHAVTGAVLSECLVKDISEAGARIILPKMANLPRQIMLHVTGEATPMSASVVWQAGTKCGVQFTDNGCV